jgi:ribosomal protein S18 acetylase RimI-like enzyme
MNRILIRTAKLTDYYDIKILVKQLYENLDVKDGMEKELKQEKFNKFLNDPGIIIYVAELDDAVVGYLTINFNKALLDVGTTAIIDELVVDERQRRKGIGKALVRKAVETAKELDCSEIGVGTESENLEAKEFYKNCGFDEIGVIFEKHLKK